MKKLEYIARIHTDFPTKFGIPRQSGLVSTKGTIVFEPEYRKEEALKGLEEYSHLWLIWEFSEVVRENWSPTVRPPRLGGNKRCIRNQVAVPAESDRIVLCQAAWDREMSGKRYGC